MAEKRRPKHSRCDGPCRRFRDRQHQRRRRRGPQRRVRTISLYGLVRPTWKASPRTVTWRQRPCRRRRRGVSTTDRHHRRSDDDDEGDEPVKTTSSSAPGRPTWKVRRPVASSRLWPRTTSRRRRMVVRRTRTCWLPWTTFWSRWVCCRRGQRLRTAAMACTAPAVYCRGVNSSVQGSLLCSYCWGLIYVGCVGT